MLFLLYDKKTQIDHDKLSCSESQSLSTNRQKEEQSLDIVICGMTKHDMLIL